MPENGYRDSGEESGFFSKAADWVTGALKRMVFHLAALGIAALIATDSGTGSLSRAAVYTLCNYAGLLYLFPSRLAILPTLAGLGLASGWLFMGYPLFSLPFWAGAYCFVQVNLNSGNIARIDFLSVVWLTLLVFLNIYAGALTPPLWPVIFLLVFIFILDRALRIAAGRRKEKEEMIKSGSHTFGDGDPYDEPAPGTVWKQTPSGAGAGSVEESMPEHWREFYNQLSLLNEKGKALDGDMRDLIEKISRHARNILQCMKEDPRDVAAGERFLSRYLPSAINVVDSCARLYPDLPEADAIIKNTLDVLTRLEAAFKNMHVGMLENDKLDAKADLAVLDKLLKMQGH